MSGIDNKLLQELDVILREDYGFELSDKELQDFATTLTNFYGTLLLD